MIQVDGEALRLKGPVTIETHVGLREAAIPYLGQTNWIVDWTDVTEVDSSALSLLFAWQRASLPQGKWIRVNNLPPNLKSLAQLYGVAELIPSLAG